MPRFSHRLSDGLEIEIDLKRSAKKNLILRPLEAHAVSINIPPFLGMSRLHEWLRENEAVLRRTLAQAPPGPAAIKPEWIWYQGVRAVLVEKERETVALIPHTQTAPAEIWLPQQNWPQQQSHLRRFLYKNAAEYLLPRLHHHAETMSLHPAAAALSNAKTFWGVCRNRTGIRLNWRLIGAPEFVADYVCVHELCHLPHPDHSPRFWHMVNRHTPYTEAAKAWLKKHGSELFVLG